MKVQRVLKRVGRIAIDRESPASKLALEAVEVFEELAPLCETSKRDAFARLIEDIASRLKEAQPSMASVGNAAALVLKKVKGYPKSHDARAMAEELQIWLRRLKLNMINAQRIIVEKADRVIPKDSVVITHSMSSTVLETLLRGRRSGRVRRVIVTESRPRFEGRSLAEKLASGGVPVTLVIDASVGSMIKESDLAIVGADRLLRDGGVVNKIGTYPLALACREHGKPFIVVCDSLKLDMESSSAQKLAQEAKPAEEVLDSMKLRGIEVRNLYFDLTPPKLISKVITELGVFKPSQVARSKMVLQNSSVYR